MHISAADSPLDSGYDSDKSGSDDEEEEDNSNAILWQFCLSQLKTFKDTRHPAAQAQGINGQGGPPIIAMLHTSAEYGNHQCCHCLREEVCWVLSLQTEVS
jgi:hypothetical protein